jgi:hypothetical protein
VGDFMQYTYTFFVLLLCAACSNNNELNDLKNTYTILRIHPLTTEEDIENEFGKPTRIAGSGRYYAIYKLDDNYSAQLGYTTYFENNIPVSRVADLVLILKEDIYGEILEGYMVFSTIYQIKNRGIFSEVRILWPY